MATYIIETADMRRYEIQAALVIAGMCVSDGYVCMVADDDLGIRLRPVGKDSSINRYVNDGLGNVAAIIDTYKRLNQSLYVWLDDLRVFLKAEGSKEPIPIEERYAN